jgi:mono/diheme cytochrome c family protein
MAMGIPDWKIVRPGLLLFGIGVAWAILAGSCATANDEIAVADPVETAPGTSAIDLSATAREGEKLFEANCMVCHGARGTGTATGPPLVHPIYEPGHHSDDSIRSAVQSGVQSHHWTFGDMPAIVTVAPGQLDQIICYVRELQVAEGIADKAPC